MPFVRLPFAPLAAAVLCLCASRLEAQARPVAETEPNNSKASANVVALGDSLTGTLAATTDGDYFALDIPAGTMIQVAFNRSTHVGLAFLDSDGETVLLVCGYEVDSCNPEPYPITRAGRYFVRLESGVRASSPATYGARVDGTRFTLGPG